nr:MAG TPA: hypothetical protein [Caudoviricetes sp.]
MRKLVNSVSKSTPLEAHRLRANCSIPCVSLA